MKDLIKKFNVQENAQFPAVDDFIKLAEEIKNDSRVKIYSDGKSESGKTLIAIEVGNGEKVVGLTAGAHADEPIGVLTLSYFIKGILKNDDFQYLLEQYTFICHPLVDPDGYQLNSIWFTNPLEYKTYFLHNFRNNNPALDCEHGIPFQDGQAARSEMIFVKENLDRYKNRFQYYVTLHSSHVLPGACFVFDQNNTDQGLRTSITKLCKEYELPMMDYKVQGEDTMTYLGPGFIGAPNVSMMLEKYKSQPEILKQIKMTTYEYAQNMCGAKTAFISELPIWLSEGMDNYNDSNVTMNDFMKQSYLDQKKYFNRLQEIKELVTPYVAEKNKVMDSLNTSLMRGEGHLKDEEQRLGSYEGYAQEMLISESKFSALEFELKALKYGIKIIENNLDAIEIRNKLLGEYEEKVSAFENGMGLKQLSIRTQVEIQLGLIFSGLELS